MAVIDFEPYASGPVAFVGPSLAAACLASWDHFSIWHHFCMIWVSLWDQFGIILRSFWHFAYVEIIWGHVGIILGFSRVRVLLESGVGDPHAAGIWGTPPPHL